MNFTTFYLIGIVIFIVNLIGGIWDLYLTWEIISMGAKIKSISGNAFSLLIIIFFLIMYKSTKTIQAIQDIQKENVKEENE